VVRHLPVQLVVLARRAVNPAVVLVCCIGVAGVVILLGVVVHRVWQQSGPIAAWLLTAAALTGIFIASSSIRWLRVVRLFAGILLTVSGTLLTLLLGYAIESPPHTDPLLGGVMLATLVGGLTTLGADLRLQHLEAREAATLAQRSTAHHRELLERLEDLAQARPAVQRHSSTSQSFATWAVGGLLIALALRRRR